MIHKEELIYSLNSSIQQSKVLCLETKLTFGQEENQENMGNPLSTLKT